MSKVFKKSYVMTALICMLIACLTCGTLVLAANAQEEEPTSTVTFTSYTTVMNVDEEFEFAALVTNQDGTTSTEVTWSSSDVDVIYFEEAGLAYANAEGTATLTATAPDGATADIEVLVSDEAARVESIEVVPAHLELGVGWKTTVTVNVLPLNATNQSYTLSSSDTDIVTVTADGYVTAVAAGEAELIATATGNTTEAGEKIQGICTVQIFADLEEAELSNANPDMIIGTQTDLTVTLPEGVNAEGATYRWYTEEPAVASFDENDDETGTLRAWSFGSTEIYALVTLADGTRYGAIGRATVNADFFYLVGMDNSGWVTYETAADAEAAGVLLVQDTENPALYSITRNIWAYQGFQIWHAGINEDRTTRIDPFWYNAAGSSDDYVANGNGMFQVNAYGVYTVTLDLSDGMAKVDINMEDVFITELNPSIAADSTAVLQNVGDKATIVVNLFPTNAIYDAETDKISVSFGVDADADPEKNGADYLSVAAMTEPTKVTDPETEEVTFSFTVTVELIKAYDGVANSAYNFPVTIAINENEKPEAASNSITLAVAPTDAVLPTTLDFESPAYYLDVNNGGKAWQMPVVANVDDEATITAVEYYSDDIVIDPATGVVTAGAFGVYHLRAVAVGNPQLVATATITVYSSQFYLAGILHSANLWDVLPYTATTIAGTDYADWGLTAVEGSYTEYEGTFSFNQYDTFSIVFLGMSDSWYGAINANNIDWDNSSSGYLYESDGNITVNETGMYTIRLNLAAEGGPRFTVKYAGEAFTSPFDMVVYLMRAGGAWDPDKSNVENSLAHADAVRVDGENASTVTITYDFADLLPVWPTFQFLTATGDDAGLAEGFWYGSGMPGVTITSDTGAFKSTYTEEEAAEGGFFTNGGSGCEFWYVGDLDVEEGETLPNLKVEFTISINQYGLITAIAMNFVTAE